MSFLQLIEIDCDLTEAMIDEALIVFKWVLSQELPTFYTAVSENLLESQSNVSQKSHKASKLHMIFAWFLWILLLDLNHDLNNPTLCSLSQNSQEPTSLMTPQKMKYKTYIFVHCKLYIRLATSFKGLNNSWAQSTSELWSCKVVWK